MPDDDLTPVPRRDVAGDAVAVSRAALPAVTAIVLGASHLPAAIALALGAAVSGGVAVTNALGGRAAGRKTAALGRRVGRNEKRVRELKRQVAKSLLVLARVKALDEQLAAVASQAAARGSTADELRDALQRPDIAFLLAQARDHYAVMAMKDRLRRHAAIVAGRVRTEPHAPMDRTLTFARAALELEDVAVVFLVQACGLAASGKHALPNRVRERGVDGYAGETRLAEFLAARKFTDTQDVARAAPAIEELVRHGFVFRPARPSDSLWPMKVNGRLVHVYDFSLAPTDLGHAFVAEIRRAGEAVPPDA